MQKKAFIVCGSACILGIFGAFIRWLQNTTAFEAGTGLPIPSALWSGVMAGFMILCVLGLIAVLYRFRGLESAGSYPEAFKGGPLIRGAASWAGMVLISGSGLITLVSSLSPLSVFDLVMGLAAIASGICLFFILRGISGGRPAGPLFVVVVLYLCLFLIWEYKNYASDPVLWHFALEILALAAVLLAFYYLAGFCYDRPKPLRAIYFSLLGAVFSISTFADSAPAASHMVSAGLSLVLLVFALLLIGNLSKPAPRPEPELREKD